MPAKSKFRLALNEVMKDGKPRTWDEIIFRTQSLYPSISQLPFVKQQKKFKMMHNFTPELHSYPLHGKARIYCRDPLTPEQLQQEKIMRGY